MMLNWREKKKSAAISKGNFSRGAPESFRGLLSLAAGNLSLKDCYIHISQRKTGRLISFHLS